MCITTYNCVLKAFINITLFQITQQITSIFNPLLLVLSRGKESFGSNIMAKVLRYSTNHEQYNACYAP